MCIICIQVRNTELLILKAIHIYFAFINVLQVDINVMLFVGMCIEWELVHEQVRGPKGELRK